VLSGGSSINVKKLSILSLLILFFVLGACQDGSRPPSGVPAAPEHVRASAGEGRVDLSWQESAGAIGYNVYRSESEAVAPSAANRRNAILLSATTLTFTDTEVENGATYYYVVTAVGPGGESRPSNRAEALPKAGLLDPPRNLAASPGNNEVRLSWEGSSGASGYNVYRSESPDVEISTANRRNSAPLESTTFTDSDVENGATYYYIVTAVGSGGESAASNSVAATPFAGALAAPTELTAEAGESAIRLSWRPSAGASGYNVYRSETPDVETSAANRRNTAPVRSSSFIDTQVSGDATYYYVVTAVGAEGESAASNEVAISAGVEIPDAPTALLVHPGDGQVTLSWRASPTAVRYHIYRSKNESFSLTAANRINTVLTPNYVDRTVANGTTYYYAVTVIATSGRESAGSNIESATPEAGAVTRPEVTDVIPPDGATNVPLGEYVSTDLYLPNGGFNEATLTPNTVRLVRVSDGEQVPANFNYSGGRDTFTLQPAELLEPFTSYRFEVGEGLRDETGVSFQPFTSTFTTGGEGNGGNGDFAFEKVALPTSEGALYTSLVIGPDGMLYATVVSGEIWRFEILEGGALGEPEVLTSLQEAEGGPRLLIGLVFDPSATADNLIAWVTHSVLHDRSSPTRPDDWTSKITRMSGPDLEAVEDYVVGLPRSIIDHVTNIPAFGPDGALYVPQGSNTSMGAPDRAWGFRPERLLTAAILRVDVEALAEEPLPLDVQTEEGGSYNPFAVNAPVTIYASGVRNAYHLLWHSNGQLYVPTNGANAGGNIPGTPSPLPQACSSRRLDGFAYLGPEVPSLTNVRQVPPDFLFRVEQGGYYGHPNPERCEWVMNGGNPTEDDDPAQMDDYPVGVEPDRNWRGYAAEFNLHASSNGIIEYRSYAFGGGLRGKMLVVRFNRYNDIVVLTPGGADEDYRIVQTQVGIEGLTGFLTPLALVESFPDGYVYVAEFNWGASGYSLDELAAASLNPMQAGTEPRITLLRPKP
jgi:fibronectin type 3 domain-containing protein/glucose/arabinose dehydrogenase